MKYTALHGNASDLSGRTYGRLRAIRPSGISKDGHVIWLCKCSCGKNTLAGSNSLKGGMKKSCGCLRAQSSMERRKREGVWNDGKSYAINSGVRCYKTRHAWAKAVIRHYGNKCEICGWSEAKCDAHHRKPKARGGLHTIPNGQVLCPNHHRIIESK